MTSFDARPSPRLLFGPGRLSEISQLATSLAAKRILLVTDPGILQSGHAQRTCDLLRDAGFDVSLYGESRNNPCESDIDSCHAFAAPTAPELIIGLGGGSSMDTAKACNFILSNGGRMSDYQGYARAKRPLLPFIAIPTTAGTGSECQSYAIISRDDNHEKFACGDPSALARIALLDPELTASQPQQVACLTALDALSHAIESAVCTRRNPISQSYSREAFRLISSAIEPILMADADLETRSRIQLGAAMAGSAIENSMLGAAHALANPLTAQLDITHAHAVSLMLPPVIRFNAQLPETAALYQEFSDLLNQPLLAWLEQLLELANLPPVAFTPAMIPTLSEAAQRQWTAQFNPRPLSYHDIEDLYSSALTPPAA